MYSVAIHQPQYLPYLGVFAKIVTSDVFVFLDNVLYSPEGFINRNRILATGKPVWLTVPLQSGKSSSEIRQLHRVYGDLRWKAKHLKTFCQSYGKLPYFEPVYGIYTRSLEVFDFCEMCIQLTTDLARYIGYRLPMLRASELMDTPTSISAQERLLRLTKEVGGDTYISGAGGLDYLGNEAIRRFHEEGVSLVFSRFSCAAYKQGTADFIPNLSIVDLLVRFSPQECLNYLRFCHERDNSSCS